MTTAGEVRMGPHGLNLAWKVPGDVVWTVSSATSNDVDYLTDADVADWALMAPASQRSNDEMVTIPKREHESLKWDSEFLRELETYGVDNWTGYDDVRDSMRSRP